MSESATATLRPVFLAPAQDRTERARNSVTKRQRRFERRLAERRARSSAAGSHPGG